MRLAPIATTLFALAAICANTASAQQIKPGLWQLHVSAPAGQIPGGSMGGQASMAAHMERLKTQMASMPPEQRKEMEKMMAQLEATDMRFTASGLDMKECLTKENMAKFNLMGQKGGDSCVRNASPIANGMNVIMKCTRPPMTMNATVKFQGDKAYSFESQTTVTGPDGKPTIQKSSGTGKWLSSDCGKVKPASAEE